MTDQPIDEPTDPVSIDAELWPTFEPSDTFASEVVAEHFGEPAPAQHPPTWRGWAAAAAVLAAAIAVLLAWSLGRESTHDSLVARSLQTVRLLDRAVAVAQPGAVMRWEVQPGGSTRVEQDAGRVFYRVDHGETFEVVTPAGTATVTGTCFEVEIDPMKNNGMKAGAAGAAIAAALVVTVYEGGVVLANDRGQVEVQAGEKAKVSGAGAPVRFSDDDDAPGVVASADGPSDSAGASNLPPGVDPMVHIRRQARDLERMRAEKDAQALKIETLQTQVEQLGGVAAPTTPEQIQAKAKKCASQSRGSGCPFLEPDQDTLLEMAKCATVKIDSPSFLDDRDSPEVGGLAKSLGLESPDDIAKLQTAAEKHHETHLASLRGMFLELGGAEAIADDASANTLLSYIGDQLDGELTADVQRRISEERAGLREPPVDIAALPIEERLLRLEAEKGNVFERHVAETLGPQRARELRRRSDGWPGSTNVSSSNCVE